MKQFIILVANLVVILFLAGCKGETPTEENIVGTWVSKDSVKIDFYKDHSFEMFDEKKIVLSRFFPETREISIDGVRVILDKDQFKGKGNWKLEEYMNYGYLVVNLNFRFEDNKESKVGGFLIISGQGILGNKPPWYLFYYIGDPDENNRYIFHKE